MKPWNWARRGIAKHRGAADPYEGRLSLPELEEAVGSVEAAARLVSPRLLRRVIRVDASLTGFGFRVPHSKTYVIPQQRLLEIADRGELGVQPTEVLPPVIVLLERPSAEDFDELSRQEILLHYWELLLHTRVHRELERALGAPPRYRREAMVGGRSNVLPAKAGTPTAERIAELGSDAFDEIRSVLRQERFLVAPDDDTAVYVEFAAVYLGMRFFKPYLVASFFPALRSLDEVDRLMAQDVDAAELLEATRLPGTPEPDELREAARKAAESFDADPLEGVFDAEVEPHAQSRGPRRIPAGRRSEDKYRNWSRRAARHASRGNFAGAAIRRARAEAWAPRERAAEAATALRDEVDRFVERLQAALDIEDDDPRPWRESLLALAHQTPRGLWTVEARLLYDLQKACIDKERATSTVDVMHWILSFGRRAIRRDLPDQRRVAMSRHLRSAQRRLAGVRISDHQRRQLAEVLNAATHAAEVGLREELRPKLAAALDAIDLRPQNLPEEVSRRKIVEELLDRIVERGFLTLGEVRDAISRNHLKEPDCTGLRSFARGEAALRADRRLADALDGVYEPGDFYLRWLLRFSHLMFGTTAGRFLTLYFIIPFGGAAVATMTLDHFIHLIFRVHPHLAPGKKEEWADVAQKIRSGNFPTELTPAIVLGVFLALLIHVRWFRRAVWGGTKWLGRAIKFLLFDVPCWILALPWIKMIVHSAAARLIVNLVVKPIVPTLIVARFVPAEFALWQKLVGLASIDLGLILVVNSRAGRILEEMAWDAIADGWQRFGVRPLVGLFWFIVDLFRRLMQGIERILYSVDEWLRFRSGQSRAMLVAKGVLGVVWFFVAYAVRFCVNLLIEPQLNPLKHIPWVSLAHKLLWLFVWPQSGLEGLLTSRMGATAGSSLFLVITMGTPGIFGFLIWELKENWRLFAANRPKDLRPVLIGSHGETMPRLLRPGIHSGTIPKRFAKLRRAERKALRGGDPGAARKHREVLHHVEVNLRRYMEREFVAWFAASRLWTCPLPQVGEIHLATNDVSIEVLMPQSAKGPRILSFRLADGSVQLELFGALCVEQLSPEAQKAYLLAFTNVLKTAAVAVLCSAISRVEVGSTVVPWSDWVAAWEGGVDASNGTAWGPVALC